LRQTTIIKQLKNSIVVIKLCLSSTHIKELADDFKGHALGFRDFQVDKEPRESTNHSIDAEHPGQAYRAKQCREGIGDNYVSKPKG